MIRAYRVGPELVAWATVKICANWGFTARQVAISNVSAVTAFWRTRTAMRYCRWATTSRWWVTGCPRAAGPSFRNGKEVFDRDLLDMRIVTEEIVVKNHNAVGRRLAQLKLTDHGCFLNRVIRSQIEMPIDDNVVLNKGDVLQVSGDAA